MPASAIRSVPYQRESKVRISQSDDAGTDARLLGAEPRSITEPRPELEVRNLVKRYSAQSAVGPISFSVAPGEFLSVLGPSGCGKTTTLRCIAGFETLDEGSILVAGKSIEREPPNRRNIGLVFQSYALFPHLTVANNVAFGLSLRRRPKDEIRRRVTAALDLVGLADLAGRYPRQLSGGQQQRVAIARSIVLEPPVLLFDEPLSNLDLKLRNMMRTELKALQRRLGKTTLYVTHDQGEALALSDRIVVMSNGRIEQIGAPHDIYERPATPFVAEFIGSSNLIKVTVESVEGAAITMRTEDGLRLKARGAARTTGALALAMIRPEHIGLDNGTGDPTGDDNVFQARLEDAVYLGQDLQVKLRTTAGLELSAVVRGDAGRRWSTGDSLTLRVSPDNVFVLNL